jgi:hypothetical protein
MRTFERDFHAWGLGLALLCAIGAARAIGAPAIPAVKPCQSIISACETIFAGTINTVPDPNRFFTFTKNGSEAARIDSHGRATCIAPLVPEVAAYQAWGNYAALYLALCNPPAPK